MESDSDLSVARDTLPVVCWHYRRFERTCMDDVIRGIGDRIHDGSLVAVMGQIVCDVRLVKLCREENF
jgi:hypothetical protein